MTQPLCGNAGNSNLIANYSILTRTWVTFYCVNRWGGALGASAAVTQASAQVAPRRLDGALA